jgi:hypothetical protein
LEIRICRFWFRAARGSEVVQATGDFHHYIVKPVFGVAENVFDNTATFDTGNHMLNDDPHFGDLTVALPVFR